MLIKFTDNFKPLDSDTLQQNTRTKKFMSSNRNLAPKAVHNLFFILNIHDYLCQSTEIRNSAYC